MFDLYAQNWWNAAREILPANLKFLQASVLDLLAERDNGGQTTAPFCKYSPTYGGPCHYTDSIWSVI